MPFLGFIISIISFNFFSNMKKLIIIAISFLWCGLIIAISFMEAPLKFRVSGMTLPVALGLGKIMFQLLNKIELVFAITIFCLLKIPKGRKVFELFDVTFILLLIQTFWMIPLLDKRLDTMLSGSQRIADHIHIFYIILEIIKLMTLFLFGILFTKKNIKS